MEITKEQVRQAYETPEKLKEFFPEAFEVEIKVGNWYKNSLTKSLFCVTSKDCYGNLYGYGFNGDEYFDYTDKKGNRCACVFLSKKLLKEATHKEVEKSLMKEAKKRGFKEGIKVCRDNLKYHKNTITLPKGDVYSFDFYLNVFYLNVFYLNDKEILSGGQWAEIIPDTLEVTLDQVAQKFGVEKIKIIK